LGLTTVDSGYLNPDERIAVVNFSTVNPVEVIDALDKKMLDFSDPTFVK